MTTTCMNVGLISKVVLTYEKKLDYTYVPAGTDIIVHKRSFIPRILCNLFVIPPVIEEINLPPHWVNSNKYYGKIYEEYIKESMPDVRVDPSDNTIYAKAGIDIYVNNEVSEQIYFDTEAEAEDSFDYFKRLLGNKAFIFKD